MTSEPTTVDTPLKKLVGERTAKALASHLDLHTAGDLIYHFPRRYDERGEHTDIRSLDVGEQVTVLAQVQRTAVRPMRQRRGNLLEVTVGDGSGGVLTLTFFGNQAWRERDLRPGRWGLFAGKVTEFRGKRQLNGPEYVLLGEGGDGEAAANEEVEEFAGALIPVYPAAAAVPTWVIARCVRVVLDTFTPPEDPLPATVRAGRNLADIGTALREIHRPTSKEALYRARRRLKWDEAFAVQLTLVQRKHRAAAWPAKARPAKPGGLLDAFDARLPYELTPGQQVVGREIAADLATAHPMHRLLQGEVGSGKTVVALRAMLQVVDAGGQAALLAPTEVLAAQHHRGILDLLGPLARAGELGAADDATRVELVTGSLGAAARRRALAEVAEGRAGIVLGTHALLYEGVDFRDLGLVVVDEQHRFGVEQRDALRAKADQPPHVLVMTATPIPRTVAMTVYGDLETSTLSQLPQGRSPIASHVVPAAEKPAFLDRAWRRLREEVANGHQAYVVCPRIGEGPQSDEEAPREDDNGRRPPLAVTEVAPLLAEGPLHGLRIGVLHGRLPADEKDAVMRSFAAGDLDVLVATTVVEVGVNVPNATVMIVLDADRFGVSQLHQLRGRVGRGSAAGLCLLVTEAVEGSSARERLDAVASTTDGFKLAELDLEQRREGDVLGATQSGRRSHLRLLSLLRDTDLIRDARAEAITLVEEDPELARHPALAASVAALVDEERAEYLEKG
ncbi:MULTISPECIES: ATP-dependent DNA helicase RecG [Micromonospora]|uniref:Probable DNA 3'-5' helicase RecG n=1 Tax=Micromonospora solifontis TaxID=2487138 RepID=A0ABX9WAM6_9ACTN|nr:MULTISPECIES: ATP-dependent DNA helicase RecG [Micromonospora]NES14024.1 ATP-dependent DNA helicase RecG [Micromonospora sp. PPF5-17B]NES38892.1 ATP-dependent DNA helicase RecG [Micromonospora solifontis]NES58817.1 ATP-dependent DNA helicase RecG [Micromonospora sp. PPF5-6]RNL92599.1 ATP-dependent DNA helicase RecG [Micromonospora solifontis]